jgi:hypothetical protein
VFIVGSLLWAWSAGRWRVRETVTVCRASTTEPALSARGYLWCECFTVVCPAGEFGHVQPARLLPLSAPEFAAARRAFA